MEMKSNGIEVLKTWFKRVWAEEDGNAIEEMFPSLGRAEGIGSQQILGPEAFRGFQAAFLKLVNEVRIEIDQGMQQGEWTAALCSLTGVCRKTERKFK